MTKFAATNFAPVPNVTRSVPVSRNLRKRFYLVTTNERGLQIVSLRHLMTDIAHTHLSIVGPFRTMAAAVEALEHAAGVIRPTY